MDWTGDQAEFVIDLYHLIHPDTFSNSIDQFE